MRLVTVLGGMHVGQTHEVPEAKASMQLENGHEPAARHRQTEFGDFRDALRAFGARRPYDTYFIVPTGPDSGVAYPTEWQSGLVNASYSPLFTSWLLAWGIPAVAWVRKHDSPNLLQEGDIQTIHWLTPNLAEMREFMGESSEIAWVPAEELTQQQINEYWAREDAQPIYRLDDPEETS